MSLKIHFLDSQYYFTLSVLFCSLSIILFLLKPEKQLCDYMIMLMTTSWFPKLTACTSWIHCHGRHNPQTQGTVPWHKSPTLPCLRKSPTLPCLRKKAHLPFLGGLSSRPPHLDGGSTNPCGGRPSQPRSPSNH